MESPQKEPDHPPAGPAVVVRLVREGKTETFRFTERFVIGRGKECDVVIDDPVVSRIHVEVVFRQGSWWVVDLKSSNGTYVDGEQVDELPFHEKLRVSLGPNGPLIALEAKGGEVMEETIQIPGRPKPKGLRRLIVSSRESAAHTREVVQRALRRALKAQARKYVRIIIVLAVIGVGALIYAYLSHEQLKKQRALAEDVFYRMKEMELSYGRLLTRLEEAGDTTAQAGAAAYREEARQLQESYDRFVSDLGIYSEEMTEQEKTIYRVARIFGECEVAVPEGFTKEVMEYVGEWKKSRRIYESVERARQRGYVPIITRALLAHHLPPQFLYLALQESEFDSSVCGPPTRFGIAKGIWQFIPATALQYGLRTGPLVHLRKNDPRDERHRVEQSTAAAARYLRDIYRGEAQASGLLVFASYNWGHNVVRNLINAMPENPRERNFWKFLQTYKGRIPQQTRDYVFYIFSAAVICENPQLFGFQLENPLAGAEIQ